ncbi:hypothetical protein GCM10008927_07040 [Amylibacter ulvae]|uniref:Probable membrane transporter protein n=1 Tax=Paramylibacter ulvae TaxID=1651968 RepID=A0ABQ3CW68_9RHOB|nr:sulfite exporter TauE/SafE family protein [Amylibacter ulvae]GHA44758.1 hypothetical protein GCM10008927_07040 [Amylibacter ulvae]
MDWTLVIITIGSFIAAFVNAAFATGGIYVLLIVSFAVLPISAAIPLQSTFSVGSLAARILFFWQHIHWRLVVLVVLGGIIGVAIGAHVFVALNEAVIAALLGVVLLVVTWAPFHNVKIPIKHPFFYLGTIHAFIATLFGVGGFLQPAILRSKLSKLEITGTLAAMMLGLDILKMVGFSAVGFSFVEYVPHIILATIAGFAGTWVGRGVTHRISETLFRAVFKGFVTLFAMRLLYKGLMGLIG